MSLKNCLQELNTKNYHLHFVAIFALGLQIFIKVKMHSRNFVLSFYKFEDCSPCFETVLSVYALMRK